MNIHFSVLNRTGKFNKLFTPDIFFTVALRRVVTYCPCRDEIKIQNDKDE
ncbi:MAG: hypothetical protein LBC74_14705 [Planctomycetaceae bacterium]|nr:hypothetical protein [Planctomycetaceae bacterium]